MDEPLEQLIPIGSVWQKAPLGEYHRVLGHCRYLPNYRICIRHRVVDLYMLDAITPREEFEKWTRIK